MPTYPVGAAPVSDGTISFGVVDAGAQIASIPLPVRNQGIPDISDELLTDTRDAIGNLTNAAVYKTERNFSEEISLAFVVPLDEAFSSVANRLNMTFENVQGVQVPISVPAPDVTFFTGASGAIIRPDGAAAAATPARVLFDSIAQIVAFLNISMQPADPSFRLINAYGTTRAAGLRGSRKAGRQVYAEEPSAGILPAGSPDTSPTAGQQ